MTPFTQTYERVNPVPDIVPNRKRNYFAVSSDRTASLASRVKMAS